MNVTSFTSVKYSMRNICSTRNTAVKSTASATLLVEDLGRGCRSFGKHLNYLHKMLFLFDLPQDLKCGW